MPENLEPARQLLFGVLEGLSEEDRKAWRRAFAHMIRMEPGELATFELVFLRNSRFHRKFFALLQIGFEAWEPNRKRRSYKGRAIEKNFDEFRKDVLILAGYYNQVFDIKGRMKLEPQSISFSNMDQEEFEAVYSSVVDVLLSEVLTNYRDRQELDHIVERVIGFV